MFNDYSKDLKEIKLQIALSENKILEGLEDLEKTINWLSDEIMEIKRHLGLESHIRRGKRFKGDILDLIRLLSKRAPQLSNEQLFYHIEGHLMANQNIHLTDKDIPGWQERDNKIIKDFREEVMPEWLGLIEFWREEKDKITERKE